MNNESKIKRCLKKIEILITHLYEKTVYILAFLFLSLLSLLSLAFTAYMPQDSIELTIFKTNTFLMVIVLAIMFLLFMCVYLKIIKKIKEKKIFYLSLVVCFLISLLLVFILNPKLRFDPELLYKYANYMQEGNYSSLNPGRYLSRYHFLLGLLSYIRCLVYFFGNNVVMVFRIINCVAVVAIVYSMHEICAFMFKKREVLYIYDLLICLCLPLFYFSTFFYGNLLSISLSSLAVLFQFRFFENKKRRYFILCSLCIAISVIAKGNSMVLLIAIVLQFAFQKKIKTVYRFLGVILPLGCYLLINLSTVLYYENISGISLNHELPKTAHIAMGLQESDKAPGWYNGFPFRIHQQTGYDTKLTSQESIKSIQSSLNHFVNDPQYALEFFGKKTISQWNNPTFQSIWIQYEFEDNNIANHLIGEKAILKKVQENFLDMYEFLIYFGALVCLYINRKKYDLCFLEIGLIFVGGFMFQLFWEAKGMHALPYFVILIPYAAFGINFLCQNISLKIGKYFKLIKR